MSFIFDVKVLFLALFLLPLPLVWSLLIALPFFIWPQISKLPVKISVIILKFGSVFSNDIKILMLERDRSKKIVIDIFGNWQEVKRGKKDQLIGDKDVGNGKM